MKARSSFIRLFMDKSFKIKGRVPNEQDNKSPEKKQDQVTQQEDKNYKPIQTGELHQTLIQLIAPLLKLKEEDIKVDTSLNSLGLDSVAFTDLSDQLNKRYKIRTNPSKFYGLSTIHEIVLYLINEHNEVFEKNFPNIQQEVSSQACKPQGYSKEKQLIVFDQEDRSEIIASECDTTSAKEGIAIIGMSGRFPEANNLDEFWAHLIAGKDCITEIPKDRWNYKDYYENPLQTTNKTNSKWGGFLKNIRSFDAGFFNISPREAELMDPQQRILLEEVWHLLEHAGYPSSKISGTQTGVFIGVCHDDYNGLLIKEYADWELYNATGASFSVLPNRISYFLNLQGPSIVTDTACSSSLIAVHQAVQALQQGECRMAIAGGVNVCCTPRRYLVYGQAGMLSGDGRCKTFDKSADGYVRGEGVGVIFLKPVEQAKADGDTIYAVIKGSAMNHGGHTSSLTVPNPNAQADLLIKAYQKAGIDPNTITYIEAHGTGTSLGDPIEINGIKKAFAMLQQGKKRGEKAYCGLGSVKTHIGHLESAAGIAGLLKVVLSLQYKKLPGNLHLKEQNPYIELDDSPFKLIKASEAWENLKDEQGKIIPRRAGVSSFGSGGANAHVVLEEYNQKSHHIYDSEEPAMIVLSARNPDRLKNHVQNLKTYLKKKQRDKSL